MSMESQGPGWWLASDGKWYPPQDSTPAVPPPPQGVPSFSGQPVPGQPMPGQPMPGQPMPGQPMPGQPMQGGYAGGPPPAKSNKGCIYALVAVGIIALLGAGGCAILVFAAKDSVEKTVNEMTVREGVGSVDEPAPVGTSVDIGDGWELQVVDADLDATEKVAENNEFSTPETGKKFIIVTFKATYSGNSSTDFLTSPEVVGSKKVRSSMSITCNMPEDIRPFDTLADVESGGTIEGAICYEVDEEDTDLRATIEQIFNPPAYFELE